MRASSGKAFIPTFNRGVSGKTRGPSAHDAAGTAIKALNSHGMWAVQQKNARSRAASLRPGAIWARSLKHEPKTAHHRRRPCRIRSRLASRAGWLGGRPARDAPGQGNGRPPDRFPWPNWSVPTPSVPMTPRTTPWACCMKRCGGRVPWSCDAPIHTSCPRAGRWRWTGTAFPPLSPPPWRPIPASPSPGRR